MKTIINIFVALLFVISLVAGKKPTPDIPEATVKRSFTIDSLGACQGLSFINGKTYLYGDREIGMIREFHRTKDSLRWTGKELKLTIEGKDIINHPTGIAHQPGNDTVFIGNSTRLNKEGTLWKAEIFCVNWKGLLATGTLDGNIINTIDDDACIQGSRPEAIRFKDKWFVATADYGNRENEVRLYDPVMLKKSSKSSSPGVLFKKFKCGPWVQNLYWIPNKNVLVLVQNKIEGRQWRLSFLDLEKSINAGEQHIIRQYDFDKQDELEGFIMDEKRSGIAVTSSRKENVHLLQFNP
ncbi:hypothetical protein [Flavihumibacter solisilvae]|uniref:Glutamine cyclotransferase n=1 Tax=Flavihumibacter solisilvae TaxID=1349421 RepID=A0A0C1IJY9_9BACT|nr:hypothetical protein [Flavihumibacter solisilvae]KIC94495.1 hypothetical protein OI18_11535 [Flavihumibacter solisilvae]